MRGDVERILQLVRDMYPDVICQRLPVVHPGADDDGLWFFTRPDASNEVQIAEYLRDQSTASDTVYAAHNFPVYAFYSERKTVSLLPIQADFDEEWREVMSEPGLLVYTHPDRLGEIHSIDTSLKPDRAFIEAHPEFRRLREFPNVTVYRYTPGVQKKPL